MNTDLNKHRKLSCKGDIKTNINKARNKTLLCGWRFDKSKSIPFKGFQILISKIKQVNLSFRACTRYIRPKYIRVLHQLFLYYL